MKSQKTYLFLCLSFIFLLFNFHLIAQTNQPSLYNLQLTKDNISWAWQGRLNYQRTLIGGSSLLFSNQFSSNLFRQSNTGNLWNDENLLNMRWQLPLSKRWQTATIGYSHILSDENTFIKFNKYHLAQSLTFSPIEEIKLSPAIGWAVEDIFGHHDEGWYLEMGLEVSKFNMWDYWNDTDIRNVIRAFPGRKNQEHSFFTGWTRQFSDYARDSLRLGYQFSDNSYYLQNRVDQERVIINARFLNNQLQYQLGSQSRLRLMTEFRNRDIDQTNPSLQNRRKEIYLGNQLDLHLPWGRFDFQPGLFFSQNIFDNPGVQTDINGLQTALTLAVGFRPNPTNTFKGRFSYTKYEFNTPDTLINDDDRDEQRFIIDFWYRHNFSPYFSFLLKGQVYLYHQIYIYATRSGNNKWNRIFQLAPQFEYKLGEWLRHRHQIKIIANYTVYDFDELFPQVRSYIFRKLVYSDSLSIRLTGNLSLNTIYQLEKEDNGTFYKDVFAQEINKTLSAHFIHIALQHQNFWGLQVTPGLTLFLRNEWIEVPSRRKIREYRSLIPRITVVYPARKRLLLYFTYAPNRNTDFGRLTQSFSTGNVRLQYSF